MWLNNGIRSLLIVVMLVLMLLLAACGQANQGDAKGDATPQDQEVYVTYDGGEVTKQELGTYLTIQTFFNPAVEQLFNSPEFIENSAKQIVAREIVIKDAGEPSVKDEEARKTYEEIKASYINMLGSEEKYNEKMDEKQLTEDQLIVFFSENRLIEQFFRDRLTEDKLQEYYEANKDNFTIATVSHILVAFENRTKEEALDRANEVLDKLKNGADFGEMAKEYSDDPGSKDNGGTYEDVAVSQWVQAFKKAALTLPLNELSEPVETEYGYHVMKVSKRETQPLDDVKEQLEDDVMNADYKEFYNQEVTKRIKEMNLPKPEELGGQDQDTQKKQ